MTFAVEEPLYALLRVTVSYLVFINLGAVDFSGVGALAKFIVKISETHWTAVTWWGDANYIKNATTSIHIADTGSSKFETYKLSRVLITAFSCSYNLQCA